MSSSYALGGDTLVDNSETDLDQLQEDSEGMQHSTKRSTSL